VVGISASQAEAYAAWLSEQTGWTFRLPTDDEWEVAARAGSEVIYPWGNDDPKKAKAANFKGNGKYKYTSPVGSFESGNNAWGISDMSGNVWEWTSTNRSEDETLRTVKGGSFMDGPTDLRISNYKNIPADVGERDVGFRLVKEVSNED
ncbi:MAG: SUMF1/EgtB/PvdO family nonheme iron enzyme, partial [Treponema sp.]|nr:SUMF1/EgtB/PvdO family nonheme iron enzyme [Treponema sp.]